MKHLLRGLISNASGLFKKLFRSPIFIGLLVLAAIGGLIFYYHSKIERLQGDYQDEQLRAEQLEQRLEAVDYTKALNRHLLDDINDEYKKLRASLDEAIERSQEKSEEEEQLREEIREEVEEELDEDPPEDQEKIVVDHYSDLRLHKRFSYDAAKRMWDFYCRQEGADHRRCSE